MKAEIAWALALLALTLGWAFLMGTALGMQPPTAKLALGQALGMGGPVYLGTGLVALISYAITRKNILAMWLWTCTLLLAFAFLGIGATKL